MGQPFRPTKLRAPSRSTAVRLAIGATVVGTLAVLRPGLVADTLTSPRALLLVVATVAVSRVSARVARPLGRGPATAAGWLPVIVVGWLFVVPYFRSTELHEQLPAVSAAVPASLPADAASSPAGPATAAALAPAVPPVDRPAPAAPPVDTPTQAPPPPAAAVSGAPSGPLVLATGSLRGIGHRASGPVSTYRLADGAMVVRFEGVDIENAPDPLVYLVPGAGRTSPGDGVRLGALKASRGSFGFQVPAGFDTRSAFTVLVWCGKFATPIATTTQAG